jgi:predicted PurR-regulated permease PerM
MNTTGERDYLGKALDIAVRLLVIGVIVLAAFRIFSPFLAAVAWGIIIAIALYPLFVRFRRIFGGRNRLTSTLFIILCLVAILAPTIWLGDSLLDGTIDIVHKAKAGNLQVPPPTEQVKTWPVIGERAYFLWQSAHEDLRSTAEKLQPQLANLGQKIVGAVAGLGGAIVLSIFALIIAGILMATAEGGGRVGRSVAVRLAGDDGPAMLELAVGTVRSVVKGVILVGLVQSLLAAVGLVIAGVPAAGLWALLVLIVAIIQLPPLLILGPIIPWVFANNDSTGIAIFFTIWSLLVSASDSFLKPLFLGRGVQVPMLVILVGAIGGLLQAGVVGLFIGPVVLAIAWELFMAWVREDDAVSVSTSAGNA